jgi:hypothetical protein
MSSRTPRAGTRYPPLSVSVVGPSVRVPATQQKPAHRVFALRVTRVSIHGFCAGCHDLCDTGYALVLARSRRAISDFSRVLV